MPVGIAVDAKHRLYVDSLYGECGGFGPSLANFHQGVSGAGTIIFDGVYDPVSVARAVWPSPSHVARLSRHKGWRPIWPVRRRTSMSR